MKQLNALGARRHQFFRAAHHRLRPLLLPALATDDLLDVRSDLYIAARQPPPAFAYFAGDLSNGFFSNNIVLAFDHIMRPLETNNPLTAQILYRYVAKYVRQFEVLSIILTQFKTFPISKLVLVF